MVAHVCSGLGLTLDDGHGRFDCAYLMLAGVRLCEASEPHSGGGGAQSEVPGTAGTVLGVPWPAWRLEAETIWFLGSWAPQVLLEALERAGAVFEDGGASEEERRPVTKADFYQLGLTGGPDSGAKRAALLKKLGLPERMTANALLEAVNLLYGREAFLREAQ